MVFFKGHQVMLVDTFKRAARLYTSTFNLCFFLSLILSSFSEYFKICLLSLQFSQDMTHLEIDFLRQSIYISDTLTYLVLALFMLTAVIYALLICIGGIKDANYNVLKNLDILKKSAHLLKKRLWTFVLMFATISFCWGLSLFLGIFFICFVMTVTFVLLPIVILGNLSFSDAIKRNYVFIRRNFFYLLYLSLVTIILFFFKFCLFNIIFNLSNTFFVSLSIFHVFVICVESLILPFVIMLSVSTFLVLDKND